MTAKLSTDFHDSKILEKYSSAFTLSDMEIFIFPELFYPLILANIMSPEIWKWRKDPWFRDIEKRNFNYRVNRIKQYIIQNYVFNLDLATWGLTTKSAEIARFADFFDINMLRQSNALFGYEGDKYYFDIDIRKHFGLDKYDSDIIPYWKTETVEAMGAFRHKENFSTGAGECVSLAALYAAAMFIVGRISLDKIFLIATPLHSQNFIARKEGLITNNRRIVTKNMWYNGTSLSEKARRAMENEKITIVSHISGYIHTLFHEATIDKKAYDSFTEKLRDFLDTHLTSLIFINFLRFKPKYKSLFLYRSDLSGNQRYVLLEKLFEYEHISKYNASPEMRDSLIKEIEGEEFHLSPVQGKIILNDLEDILNSDPGKSLEEYKEQFILITGNEFKDIIEEMFLEIWSFIHTDPRLPDHDKKYVETGKLEINTDDDREKIVSIVMKNSDISETARIALYAFRQMDMADWLPFVKAAIERNPVCFNELNGKAAEDVFSIITGFPDESVYDGQRLALPDEVWNFRRGDGIEKALLLADFIHHKDSSLDLTLEIDKHGAVLKADDREYTFKTQKNFKKKIEIRKNSYSIS
ncbi:MAG TPA: hypothetical protein VJ963_11660 [Bacteroidales bacterium]|nr:hypothetical protein [Bacteroidales bacterium]